MHTGLLEEYKCVQYVVKWGEMENLLLYFLARLMSQSRATSVSVLAMQPSFSCVGKLRFFYLVPLYAIYFCYCLFLIAKFTNSFINGVIRGQFRKHVEKTPEDFFLRINHILKEGSEICWNRIKKFPCSSVPYKPEGSVFLMVTT